MTSVVITITTTKKDKVAWALAHLLDYIPVDGVRNCTEDIVEYDGTIIGNITR
jgi:hypothetical protein